MPKKKISEVEKLQTERNDLKGRLNQIEGLLDCLVCADGIELQDDVSHTLTVAMHIAKGRDLATWAYDLLIAPHVS